MAQSKKKRRRKHRGTPAGTIERPGRSTSAKDRKPRSKEEARAIARQRRAERLDTPPNWRSAINRAAIAALLFGVLIVLAFKRPIGAGIALAVLMFVIYIPLGYGTDMAIYRFRQRRKAAQ